MALYPESLFVLKVSDTEITNQRPDGRIENIKFSDLKRVLISTNDTGPWGADVWWIFEGPTPEHILSFPKGATGEKDAIDKILLLPGFNHGQMIAAMRSTSNALFECWEVGPQ